MDLKTYLADSPGGGVLLAEKLKVAPAYLSQMVNGHRAISPERCVAIEKATDGKVTRRDLRPDDWKAIWPELERRTAPRPDTDKPQARAKPQSKETNHV